MNTSLSWLPLVLLAIEVHATAPRLTGTAPPGAQRGTDVEVRFSGQRLDDAQEIVFYEPGIEVLKLEGRTNSVKATLRIAATCQPGEHLVRVRTASGISDLRTFWVGTLPTIAEKETNQVPATAQPVALGQTIQGTVGGDDVDVFKVVVRKGQRLSAEVEAVRLGRTLLDTHLEIRDAAGHVLGRCDDTPLLQQDSAVSVIAPADGPYFIELRDSTYSGSGADYRLHIGSFPRPVAVFPPGGRAGQTVEFRFVSEDGTEFRQPVELPASARDRFGVFPEQDGVMAPSPNWVRVSDFPDAPEIGDNRSAATAVAAPADPPVAFNGIVAKSGEVDWYRFPARKSEPLDLQVFARRLRSPLDAVLEVCDLKGAVLASNDDGSGLDPGLKFTAPADGDFLLRVKDQLGQGGPGYTYRVEITPVKSSLAVIIPEVARNDSQTRQWIAVPRGNRFATMVNVKRTGVSGEVTFALEDGPPEIRLVSEPFPAKMETMPLVFEAPADAPLGGHLAQLVARPTDPAQASVRGVYQQRASYIDGPNQSHYYRLTTDRIYAAVVAEAPFKVRIEEPRVPLVQFGSMDLRIIAERKAGFNEAINVKLLWNPPGIGSLPDITIPKGASTAGYTINASGTAEARTWKLVVLATATVRGGAVTVSSAPTPLEVAEPFLVGTIAPVVANPGQTAKIVCRLDQRTAFEGEATLKLMGLPEKLVTTSRTITAGATNVTFDVVIDATAAPGSFKNLFITADLRRNGQTIPHTLAPGGVLRVVPPKKTAGKVASR